MGLEAEMTSASDYLAHRYRAAGEGSGSASGVVRTCWQERGKGVNALRTMTMNTGVDRKNFRKMVYHNMLDQSAMFKEDHPPWLDGLGDCNGRERKGDLGESWD